MSTLSPSVSHVAVDGRDRSAVDVRCPGTGGQAGAHPTTGSGVVAVPVATFPIVVDARGLSLAAFQLDSGDRFATSAPQRMKLAAGSHRLATLVGPAFEFAITDRGVVAYGRALRFVSGAGTPTLVVLGFPI